MSFFRKFSGCFYYRLIWIFLKKTGTIKVISYLSKQITVNLSFLKRYCDHSVLVPSQFRRAPVTVPTKKKPTSPYRWLPFLADHHRNRSLP
jgi:hypothetical protein